MTSPRRAGWFAARFRPMALAPASEPEEQFRMVRVPASRVGPGPKPAPLPIVERTDEEWQLPAKRWRALDDEIKVLETMRAEVAAELAALEPDGQAHGGGARLERYWQRGQVDIDLLTTEHDIPTHVTDSYRGPWRPITRVVRTR